MNKQTEIIFTGIESRIIAALNSAKSAIVVQQFQLTSVPIIGALVDASKRGVPVRVVLDSSMAVTGVGSVLNSAAIAVWYDYKHQIAHNKLSVVDGKLVIGGSYNWSFSAEHRNAENAVFMRNAAICGQVAASIELHIGHSKPFVSALPKCFDLQLPSDLEFFERQLMNAKSAAE